jgi:serine/threonine protein kinase
MPSNVDLTGQTLGRYEIRELIYNGTIVAHYAAFQPGLDRKVTVQTLQKHYRHDRQYNQAFAKAAKIIAEYEHPAIVPIIDFGIDHEITFIVMRMLRGGTLTERLKQGALSFQDSISVVRQIAGALEYVHAEGTVHGSPGGGSIAFDSWGNAYLADFIIAGFLSEVNEAVIGTPAYMAPERWREQPPTPQSDQYALAAITWEMLTGKILFTTPTQHLTAAPEPPQMLRPEIPTAVNDVLFRALAKDPAERYPTVSDFAREFEKALSLTPQHLFISYSRRDKDFAQRLKDHLRGSGFTIWIDEQIEHGDHWFNEINDAIRTCAAFLVLMSPEAEHSEWVQKEILLAKRYKKPIFPLLLSGDEFPLLIDLQFADVRDGELPGTDFHRRVSKAVYGTG